MTGGRARGLALALLVVGAGLMLFAGGREWFAGRLVFDGLPAVPIDVSGRDVAPIVSAIGLLGLAGAGVVLFVGTLLRRIVAVVVLVGAVAALVRCVDVVLDQVGATLDTAPRDEGIATGGALTGVEMSAWPWVAVVGSVLVVAGAALVLVTVGRWPRASRRYEQAADEAKEQPVTGAPGAPAAVPYDDSDALWKALDRGEDPTDRAD